MGVTLFVGNGINRLDDSNHLSWEQVLRSLAQKIGDESVLDLQDEKPFTLLYEALRAKQSQKIKNHSYSIKSEYLLKKYVAKTLYDMKSNEYHKKLLNLGVKNIITPNYDYSFEKSVGSKIFHSDIVKEKRYSAFRRTLANSSYIWHMHGEIETPDSIMLGYEQYGGYLQKIRTYLLPIKKSNAGKLLKGTPQISWVDLFLRDDVHILGFSMDYSEIDIWWLLSFKARYQMLRKLRPGKTFYHSWSDKEENDRDKAKLQLLEALGVKVYRRYEVESYKMCYEEFIKNFESGSFF